MRRSLEAHFVARVCPCSRVCWLCWGLERRLTAVGKGLASSRTRAWCMQQPGALRVSGSGDWQGMRLVSLP